MPEFTADTAGMGNLRILEALRHADWPIRFYQAGSSEMYGKVARRPQTERTPFHPRSPYAVSKVFAHWMTVNYREAYDLFAVNGILFNHESPRRGETFVTRKITRGIAAIKAGREQKLYLGNLDARRDWGYAPEYVEAMWLMLQQDARTTSSIATGETHSVAEFVEVAFGSSDWTGTSTSRSTRGTSARPRSTSCCWVMRARRRELGWKPHVEFPRARPHDARRGPGRPGWMAHEGTWTGTVPGLTARSMADGSTISSRRRILVTGGGGVPGTPRARRPRTRRCADDLVPAERGLRPPDRGGDRGRLCAMHARTSSSTSRRWSAGSAPIARTRADSSTTTRSWASS